ncbi:MAG: acyltransferase [Candidatus Obscuribacter sp.]|nr:acyltransferase [Candidatus Obscuribacter sp.]
MSKTQSERQTLIIDAAAFGTASRSTASALLDKPNDSRAFLNFSSKISERKILFLDGLRTLAILPVLGFHQVSNSLHSFFGSSGWVGVETFFVISGFLITNLCLSELSKTGTLNLKYFWARRILRIAPALLVFLVVAFAFGAGLPYVLVAACSCFDILLVTNFIPVNLGAMPLVHTWTLGIEEKFYLILPLVLLTWRSRLTGLEQNKCARSLFVLLLSAFLFMVAYRSIHYLCFATSVRLFAGFDTHLDGLLLGAASAVLLHYRDAFPGFTKLSVHWIVVVLLFACFVYSTLKIGHPELIISRNQNGILNWWMLKLPLHSLVTTALLVSLLKCANQNSPVHWLLSNNLMVFVGRLSYSLYLWHGIATNQIYQVLITCQPHLTAHVDLVKYSLCLGLASFSYFLIEKPFLKLKDRFKP